jgi:PKD repeat protein
MIKMSVVNKSFISILLLLIFVCIPISAASPNWVSYNSHWKTTDGLYTIEMWNATGTTTWTVDNNAASVEYLVIGGGGGGNGDIGGGGGAGQFSNGTLTGLTPGNSISVTVGVGGTGGSGARPSLGATSGGVSNFSTIGSNGGGQGGSYGVTNGVAGQGYNGASGGGASGIRIANGGTGTNGYNGGNNAAATTYGGGGGGAGAAGGTSATGGYGGTGVSTSITSENRYYAGGGGGSNYPTALGNGGIGGGGAGGGNTNNAVVGEDGTGSGGGAGGADGGVNLWPGKKGGSGLVVIKYLSGSPSSFVYNITSTFKQNINTGVSPTVQFNDTTSTYTPITWEWYAYNNSGNNSQVTFSTTRNATYTFPIGNWQIKLNSSNASYSNISSQITFINSTLPTQDFWYQNQYNSSWIMYNGTNIYEKWNTTGTFSWVAPFYTNNVSYLVVGAGGGGGGGAAAGVPGAGGGAGGVVNGFNTSVSNGVSRIVITAGGNGGGAGTATKGTNGGNTTFNNIDAFGGGAGGAYSAYNVGNDGGSGGGSVYNSAGGNGKAGQGLAGGGSNWAGGYYLSGGGGGNGSVGNSSSSSIGKGDGGFGYFYTDLTSFYAAGGGSGASSGVTLGGHGGSGIGGNGGDYSPAVAATVGTSGSGGGGGASGNGVSGGYNGAAGGSGIVIIKYNETLLTTTFTSNTTSGSSPLQIQFNDTTIGNPTSWEWSYIGYGSNSSTNIFSTVRNATGTFMSGNFSIKLNSSTSRQYNLSAQTTWINVSSVSPPIVNFTYNNSVLIQGEYEQFTSDSITDITSYNWSFGDGNFSSIQNPLFQYNVPGVYSVGLDISNASGFNSTIKNDIILVTGRVLPIVNFTANITEIIASTADIQFTDDSDSYNTLERTWDFGDGDSTDNTLQNPIHSYLNPGLYTVSLSLYNLSGTNSTTKYDYINITSAPVPINIWYSNVSPTNLPPFTVQFTDESENADDWYWDFGDGETSNEKSPTHTYTILDSMGVTHNVSNTYGLNNSYIPDYISSGKKVMLQPNNNIVDWVTVFPSYYYDDIYYRNESAGSYIGLIDGIGIDFNSPPYYYTPDLGESRLYTQPDTVITRNFYIFNTTMNLNYSVINATMEEYVVSVGTGGVEPPNLYVGLTPYTNSLYDDNIYIEDASKTSNIKISDLFDVSLLSNGMTNKIPFNDDGIIYINKTGNTYISERFVWDIDREPSPPQSAFEYNTQGTEYPNKFIMYYGLSIPPVVNFTYNNSVLIQGEYEQFTSDSITNITGYNWSFGDGNLSTTQNPLFQYNVPGVYSVGLNVTNITGLYNFTSKNNIITVTTKVLPIVNFTANSTGGIQPKTIQFTSDSITSITAYNWSFGNGNFSTTQNPVFTYDTPGTFSVGLNVTNASGYNLTTKNSFITITSIPYTQAAFVANTTLGLNYGMVVHFEDLSTNSPSSWYWDFGDGGTSTLQNPTYIYDVGRSYNVSLRSTNAYGSDWENKSYYINLTTDLPNVGAWSHFDGANGGTIFIDEMGSAISSSGATTSSTQLKFGNASLYLNTGASYISTPNSSRNWFGNGPFTLEGWMFPTSTGAGNQLWQSKTDKFLDEGWGFYHGNNSAASNDWHFFMGNSATNSTDAFTIPLNTWTHVAAQRYVNGTVFIYLNGNYTTSKSMIGMYDTSNPYRIGRQGTGALSNSFVGYTDEARGSNIVRWYSNFTPPTEAYRDGTTVADINPLSTFRFKTDTGGIADVYNQTNGGVRNRTIQLQNVNNATYIVGSMTFDENYLYVKNIYPNTSTWNDVSIVSSTIFNELGYLEFNVTRPGGFAPGTTRSSFIDAQMLYWNYTPQNTISASFFGYGILINESTQISYPVHNFIETDLTMGGWDFYPNFTSNVTSGIAPTTIQITDTTIGYPSYWNYSWGDNSWTNGTNPNPIHTYTSIGNYSITLVEQLNWNMSIINSTTKTNYIRITELPSVTSFTQNVTEGLYVLPVQFTDTTTGSPTSWNYSFGDGTLSTLQNPLKIYSTGGNYTIKLYTNNSNTTQTSYTSYVNVWNHTQVGFTANITNGIIPSTIKFTRTAPIDNATSWYWDFGDGDTSTDSDPIHTYNTLGVFSVSETANNTHDSNSVTRNNYITITELNPISDFSANETLGIRPMTVAFTDLSTNSPTHWSWDFGDTQTSTLQNPTHTYTTSGLYTITLNATNTNTTYIPTTKVNYINVTGIPPTSSFTGTPLSGDFPLSVVFTSTSTGDAPITYNWSFGDGLYSELNNPTHIYTSNGLFTVNLTTSNSYGYDIESKIDYVNVTYPYSIVNFTSNVTFGYKPFTVQFNDTSSNNPTVFNWSFGDGTLSSDRNSTHTYTSVGHFTVTLVVTNPRGNNQTTKINYINSETELTTFTMNVTKGSPPLAVQFNDTSVFIPTSWNWTFADGTFSDIQNPVHVYTIDGIYNIFLNASNSHGFNITSKYLVVSNTSGGGSSSGSSYTSASWVDPNTMLAASAVIIPGTIMCIYLIFKNKKRDD